MAAIVRRVVLAAAVVYSIGTRAQIVGRSIRRVRMTARRAARATGAAAGISIRLDTRRATNATARTTVATASRIVSVRSVVAGIAVAVPRRVVHAARSADADRVAIRTTTLILDRRLLRPRIRITRCVDRGIFCWVIRLRLGLIEKAEGGSAEGGMNIRRPPLV
jgi:hypothetical protein